MLAALANALVLVQAAIAFDPLQAPATEASTTPTEFERKLAELAAWCDEQGLPQQAKRTRAWLSLRDPRKIYVYDVPLVVDADKPPESAAPEVVQWHGKFMALRRSQAESLFQQARQAAAQKQVSLAFDLVGQTLREDPDHAAARKLLGYQQQAGQWHTTFTSAKKRLGQVWHNRFGWIPEAHIPRYEAGERYRNGRWITAAQDAALHAQIDQGWEVETEHFAVTTNHSLEAAVELAEKLECVHRAWRQVCAAYLYSPAEVAKLFDGGRPARSIKRHQVVYFRSQDEFKQALRGEIPEQVNITGIYIGARRKAYFYAPPKESTGTTTAALDDSTLYHEAAHQLFSESRTVAPDLGREANFWVVEGIACYFESLTPREGCVTLGGSDTVRFRDARYRLLQDNFYVPLGQLARLGMSSLQRDPKIAMLYTQSAGLTHFFMHHEGGRYRDPLMSYLAAIYSGRDRATTLAELTGQSFGTLDEQYRAFVEDAK
jgi:hypothetical protein